MQKVLFALSFWAVYCVPAFSQVWHGDIYLRTQADLDSFPLKYGPVEVLSGNLVIGGVDSSSYSNINDLSALGSLHFVWGSLVVLYNESLESIHGLEMLDTVYGNLAIINNPQLQDLHGFQALREIGNQLIIGYNNGLQNLAGLDSLRNVGDDIFIRDNGQLHNLQGLGAIKHGFYIYIFHNDQLESLVGLDSLRRAISLEIVGNRRLKTVEGIDGLETAAGDITIAGNDSLEHCTGFRGLHKAFRLIVEGNPRLLDFAGGFGSPDSLEVGRLSVRNNPRLRNLNGLQHLTTLLLSANVELNDSLQSLYGLDITRIGPPYPAPTDLYIRDNPALTDLALNQLRVIGQPAAADASHVEIRRNRSLKTLNGLAVLDSCHARLSIGENDSLKVIDLPSLRYGYNIAMGADSVEGSRVGPFESLEYVGQDLYVTNVKNTEGFAHLRKTGGTLRIVVDEGHVKGFNQLQRVGQGLSLYGSPFLDILDGFHALKATGASLGCSNVRDTMRAFEQVDTVGYIPNSSFGAWFSNILYNGCYFDSCYQHLSYISGTFNHGSGLVIPGYLGDTLPTFPVLQKIGQALKIYNQERGLSTINVFPQLTRIGPNTYYPQSAGGIFIANNGRLRSLDGLEHLTKIVGKIEIYENDSLTDCSALCPVLQHAIISGPVTIHSNPFPCSSKPEVLAWCDTAYVSGGGLPEALPFALWPNPTTGGVQVQLPEGAALSCVASLYDGSGRRLWQAAAKGAAPEFVLPVLPAGVYLFMVESGGQRGWRRLVLLPK